MATTPGTSLASTACFSTLSMRARDCGVLPCAAARRNLVAPPKLTDVATATAAAPFKRSRRLCSVGVIAWPSLFEVFRFGLGGADQPLVNFSRHLWCRGG